MFKCERVLLQSFTVRRFWGKRKEKYEREEYAKDEDEEFSCLSMSVFLSALLKALRMYLCVFMNCVTCRVRIANQVVMDSRCRGGIVHIRDVCSRAPSVPPERSKALWRFRVSTSNSPSGRT